MLAHSLLEIEAGPRAEEYRAWGWPSITAALDATFAAVLRPDDVVLASASPHGLGPSRLAQRFSADADGGIRLRFFEGVTAAAFGVGLERAQAEAPGARLLVWLESPCRPHGYVLDLPGICQAAHASGHTVLCDRSLGTPFLQPTLRRADPRERPDLVIQGSAEPHGAGLSGAGLVIARRPGAEPAIGSGFLAGGATSDELATAVMPGPPEEARAALRGLELRLLESGVGTMVLVRALAAHRLIRVQSSAAPADPNLELARRLTFLGLPAPFFSFDFEPAPGEARWLDPAAFARFVALLQADPTARPNPDAGATGALRHDPGITPTTICVATGDGDPRLLLLKLLRAAQLAIEPVRPGFMRLFPRLDAIDRLYERAYLAVHHRYIRSRRTLAALAA